MHHRTFALASLLLALGLPAGAAHGATLKVPGTAAKVGWPAAPGAGPTTVEPGARLRITLQQPKSDAKTLTVRFAQQQPTRKVIREKGLRSGSFSIVVPPAAGATYELSLQLRSKTLKRSAFVVAASELSPPSPAPAPAATPAPSTPSPAPTTPAGPAPVDVVAPASPAEPLPVAEPDDPGHCVSGPTLAAEVGEPSIRFHPQVITVSVPVKNTGDVCWTRPAVYPERLENGAWVSALSGDPIPETPDWPIAGAGAVWTASTFLPPSSPPGRYRLTVLIRDAYEIPGPRNVVVREFDLPAGPPTGG